MPRLRRAVKVRYRSFIWRPEPEVLYNHEDINESERLGVRTLYRLVGVADITSFIKTSASHF